MAWHRRWLGFGLIGVSAWLAGGCASQLPDWAQSKQSMSTFITEPGSPRLRGQMPDTLKVVQITAPQPLDTPPPPISGTEQVSYTNRGTVRVRVRAWVNGRPIFDGEVMQMAGPEINRLPVGLSSAERSLKLAEIVNSAIEQLVDQELMYQDAIKKLEKGNPHAIGKLKEFVELEWDKSLQKMREAGVPERDIREIEPSARRMLERNLISSEYARSRIKPAVDRVGGLLEVREYYETHLNEFGAEDKVVWQDIFIPLNPNQPTIEDLKRFAEELVNRCRNQEDFNKLIVYDGLGKNGDGLGQRRGEIRPAELEPYLFALEPGKIGPIVPFPTGVHLIRVTKREFKGQLPLNDEVAKVIRKKLEKELADREYRRMVRELRARSIWRLEKDTQ